MKLIDKAVHFDGGFWSHTCDKTQFPVLTHYQNQDQGLAKPSPLIIRTRMFIYNDAANTVHNPVSVFIIGVDHGF